MLPAHFCSFWNCERSTWASLGVFVNRTAVERRAEDCALREPTDRRFCAPSVCCMLAEGGGGCCRKVREKGRSGGDCCPELSIYIQWSPFSSLESFARSRKFVCSVWLVTGFGREGLAQGVGA